MATKTGKLLRDLLDKGAWQSLGDLPDEATFATTTYCQDSVDKLPSQTESLKIFQAVPARWTELPMDVLKERVMRSPELNADFKSFDEYHAWYMKAGPVPTYGADNRWPCIPSDFHDEAFQDGWHRFHAYVAAGHATVPVMEYDAKSWWKAHSDWAEDPQPKNRCRGPR